LRELALAIFHSEGESITEEAMLKLPATDKFQDLITDNERGKSLKNVLVAFYFQAVEDQGRGGGSL